MTNNIKLDKIRAAISAFKDSMGKCTICPRKCGVNRAAGELGYCRAPKNAVIYSYLAHHGEEPALSGRKGSGTIFFAHCNMKCVYCQNYIFSQQDKGEEVSADRLASIMLDLQDMGCHNINLVSPTHFVPQILAALEIATVKGLKVPIVYNTGGYDSDQTIKDLEGVIDVYLPDMRYSDARHAKAYSDAPDYVERNRACVKQMYGQIGNLIIDDSSIAIRGLIIRLLVLPSDISGISESLRFIRDQISSDTYLSVMSQYYPTFRAGDFDELARGMTEEEYKIRVDEVRRLGLNNGWIQDMPEGADTKFLGTNIKPKSSKKAK